MRRPLLWGFSAAAAALLTYLYIPLPGPNVPPASAGDCVELHLYSNGYHSDLAAPASLRNELIEALPDSVQRRLDQVVSKDLVNVPPAELRTHFAL